MKRSSKNITGSWEAIVESVFSPEELETVLKDWTFSWCPPVSLHAHALNLSPRVYMSLAFLPSPH